MSEQQPNGLAALTAQRTRAKRAMPAPRHPVGAGIAKALQDVPDPVTRPVVAEAEPAPSVDPGFGAEKLQGPQASPSPNDAGTTFKVTLYVDRRTDDFMEATRVEGLTSRPKVDVSRSAVVRLALRRLMDDMTPAEVKSVLQAQPVREGVPGRKRR